MKPFSFVHTADIHLGSPFRGLSKLAPGLSEELYLASFRSFDRIIELCLDERVDFLAVAGDIYEGPGRRLDAQMAFRDGIARLDEARIPSFIAHGNHDPLDRRFTSIKWPDSMRVFGGDDVETVEFKNRDDETVAYIHGISFPRAAVKANLSKKFKRRPDRLFHVGVLHCNVGNNANHDAYASCSLADLSAAGMDYWALGHIHKPSVEIERNPCAVYPGIPQGRDIGETGERGCYLVRVGAGGEIALEFRPMDVVRWERADVPIDGLDDVDGLVQRVVEKLQAVSREAGSKPSVVRVSLVGRGPLHQRLLDADEIEFVAERIREEGLALVPRVVLEKFVNRAGPDVDLDELIKRESLRGEYLRILRDLRQAEGAEEELREVLKPVFRKSKAGRYLQSPGPDALVEIIDAAQGLGIDLLEPEDRG